MLFSAKTLNTLEYYKILEKLSDLCATEGAKARAMSLMPTDDFDTVVKRQSGTDDAKRLINAKGYPSFSAGERVCSSADRAYKGAYQYINRAFVRHMLEGASFRFVNREDDAGDEGLRQAKLSYIPAFLAYKYRAVLQKRGNDSEYRNFGCRDAGRGY